MKQPRYDQLVAVRYHKEDLTDNIDDGDFIDDDALMKRFPPGNDVHVTSLPVRTAGGERLPITSKQQLIISSSSVICFRFFEPCLSSSLQITRKCVV